MYPKTSDSHFNMDYYLNTHTPLVEACMKDFGLKEVKIIQGVGTLDGKPPQYEVIAYLSFPSIDHLQRALAKSGSEILGDIPNFTNVQPLIQLNETRYGF
jgi:uncharacterized protein (TIGR02118 family)